MSFAKRLEKAIIECGKPMKQIARELGVSASHLSDLKNGKKWARPSMYRRLADYFALDLGELLVGRVEYMGGPNPSSVSPRAVDTLTHILAEVRDLDAEAKRLRGEIVGLRDQRKTLRKKIAALRAHQRQKG